MEKIKRVVAKDDLLYPELSYTLMGCAFEVFNELGPGHLEKFYQRAYAVALEKERFHLGNNCMFPYFLKDKLLGKVSLILSLKRRLLLN